MIATWDDVFAAFDGPTALGKAIGVSRQHAAVMRLRGSIPVSYWPQLVASGVPGLTFDALAGFVAGKTKSLVPEAGV